jgi:hypothetical protein
MSEPLREQVSALLDGELPEGEMSLLVRRLERDAELRGAFGRYVLIGESLRSPGGALASRSFAARVSAALDESAGAPAAREPAAKRSRWAQPMAFATAAAGALFAVGAAWMLQSGGFEELGPVTTTAQHLSGPADYVIASTSMDEDTARLVMAHADAMPSFSRRLVLSNLVADDPAITDRSAPGSIVPAIDGSPIAGAR